MAGTSMKCSKGHDDWRIEKDGGRRCMTCRKIADLARKEKNRKPKGWGTHGRMGDRGERIDTFSYSEIMKARGYVR
jgi:hypothetical protein